MVTGQRKRRFASAVANGCHFFLIRLVSHFSARPPALFSSSSSSLLHEHVQFASSFYYSYLYFFCKLLLCFALLSSFFSLLIYSLLVRCITPHTYTPQDNIDTFSRLHFDLESWNSALFHLRQFCQRLEKGAIEARNHLVRFNSIIILLYFLCFEQHFSLSHTSLFS